MNKFCLVATKFENIAHDYVGHSFGFRMYDEYMKAYDNTIPEAVLVPMNDLELLQHVIQNYKGVSSVTGEPGRDCEITNALEFIKDHEEGIEINGQWYDWSQIKSCFDV